MNILLTSVGRRSYLVKFFKEAVGPMGEIHVSNSSSLSPAFKHADKSIVTPLIYDGNYIDFLLDYCKSNKIDALISLFDIDLPILSSNIKKFQEIGVQLIISNEEVINICNDKWASYLFFKENGFNVPRTFISYKKSIESLDRKEIEFPVIIKPRWGMGSIGVYEADDYQELEVFYKKTKTKIKSSYLKYESQVELDKSIIIQEKLSGQEYGLDVINNLEAEYQNTIVKKKIAMRSGETDCSEIVYSPLLKGLGRELSVKLKHIANLDVDIFLNDGIPYVLECNARFGGGYPFSHMGGVNLPAAIIKWLKNEEVEPTLLSEKIGKIAHKDIEIIDISNNQKKNYDSICSVNNAQDIYKILTSFDTLFIPSLSKRNIDFKTYSAKLFNNGYVYSYTSKDDKKEGFISFYANDHETKIAYLNLLAVKPDAQNKGIGKRLIDIFAKESQNNGMLYLKLEVNNNNDKAIKFYEKNGFRYESVASNKSKYMIKKIYEG